MKYILAFVVFVAAGSLFFWAMNAQEMPGANTQQQDPTTNPFGEGSSEIGELEDDIETGQFSEGATISSATLAQHDQASDCWVAYKGVVYDITHWLPRHPGSSAAIAPYCGTSEEFSAAFGEQHGTSKEGKLKQEGVIEGSFTN